MVRRLLLVAVAVVGLGLIGCAGDGDVVLPSDTQPPATTARRLTCADLLPTTTTVLADGGTVSLLIVGCDPR